MINYCKTCGFRDLTQPQCLLHSRPIDPAADFCSWHCIKPIQCDLCGAVLLKPLYEQRGARIYTLCGTCAAKIDGCGGCVASTTCAFQSDPSPLPQFVIKTVKQGPMVERYQVRNPDREAATCALGCPCWNKEEKTCYRAYHWCDNYEDKFYVKEEDN